MAEVLRWKKVRAGVYHATSPWGLYTIDGNNFGRNRWTVTYPGGDYGMADALAEAKLWAQQDADDARTSGDGLGIAGPAAAHRAGGDAEQQPGGGESSDRRARSEELRGHGGSATPLRAATVAASHGAIGAVPRLRARTPGLRAQVRNFSRYRVKPHRASASRIAGQHG